jgi:hypothetical protein
MPLGLGLIMGLGHNPATSGGGGGGGGPTAYRAFKMSATRAAGDGVRITLSEFEASTTSGGTNFLLGCTVTPSSTGFGTTGAELVDGNTGNFWASADSSYPASAVFDLGAASGGWKAPFEFRLVGVSGFEAQNPGSFTIQGTTGDPAGSPTWTTLVTVAGLTTGDWSGTTPKTFTV